jgi:hypothetical protein
MITILQKFFGYKKPERGDRAGSPITNITRVAVPGKLPGVIQVANFT